jgi:Leucine-rich repeat (LRR) protein
MQLPPIVALRSLQVLDAGENQISEFPVIGTDCALSILHLDCNRITQLDADRIRALRNSLCELHIHDNKLTVLCADIGLLKQLKVLDITNNDVGDLPSSLGYMETLQR